MLSFLAVAVVAAASADAKASDELAQDLRHAETYYALGALDPDSATAAQGMSWAESASQCPNSTDDHRSATVPDRLAIDQTKLDQLGKAAAGTLNSVFPLTRFFKSRLFSDVGIGSEYDLTGNAAADAAIDASGQALARVAAAEKGIDSLPVLFIVLPPPGYLQSADRRGAQWNAEQLEGSLAAGTAGYPQFVPYQVFELKPGTRDAIRALLPKTDPAELPKSIADRVSAELAASFKKSEVLVIVVRMKDAVETVYDCTADVYLLDGGGTAKERNSANASSVFPNFTIDRLRVDRHDRAGLIVLANVLLLVLACALHRLIAATHATMISERSWRFGLLAPLAAFAIGRAVPYAIAPALVALHVSPEASAATSFWYPCLLGLGLIGVPLIAYWLASQGLAQHWSLLSVDVRGGALFAAVGAGIAAYMAGPLLLYGPLPGARLWLAAINCVLMAASIIVVAYVAGRSLDRADPLSAHIAAPFLTIVPALVGLAVLSADTGWLSACTAAVVVAAAAVVRWDRAHKPPGPDAGAEPPPPQAGDAGTSAELARRAENPDFQQSPRVQAVVERLAPLLRGEACRVVVVGSAGAGKTATVDAAIARFVREFPPRASHGAKQGAVSREHGTPAQRVGTPPPAPRSPLPAATVLRGSCPAPGGETIAFAPFRQALARHFAIDFFAESEPKLQQISQALGGIVGSFIPFSTILFHHPAGDGAAAVNEDQIDLSIAWMLRRLAARNPVILLLDDAQWLDESSMRLVKRLVEEFPPGERPPVAIVLVASDLEPLKLLEIDEEATIEIAYPSREEQVQILVQGVGLNKDVAETILARVGAASELRSGLHWPLQIVAQLARAGAFVPGDNGFVWAGGCWPADFQIPSHIEAIIQRQLADAAKYRTILQCAACCADGREFNASLVAAALDQPCLDLLVELDEIERTTGMVRDVRERDDIYEFHSWFLVEEIRRSLGLDEGEKQNGDITHLPERPKGCFAQMSNVPVLFPQLVREYHGRLAAALESVPAASANKVFDLATYYYVAGVRYAPKGVEHCLRAADAAASMCDFAAARRYLQMAERSAQWTEKSREVAVARQLVHCLEARVTAHGSQRFAALCEVLQYLKENPDAPAPLLLAAAELCYAEAHRSRRPDLLQDATRLCRQIADPQPAGGRPDAPSIHEKARALHIMALSLPGDQRADRIAALNSALHVVQKPADDDPKAARCLAQIVNSLAKELAKSTDANDRQRARELFETRLKWETQRRLNDPHGRAMALGGLGRLHWFAAPRDIDAAEPYFREALEISEQICDSGAQVKLHSFLGACALEKGQPEDALAHYSLSAKLRGDRVDQWFSGIGLMRCCAALGRIEQCDAEAAKLLDLLTDEGPPPDCKPLLRQALQAGSAGPSGPSMKRLRDRLRL